MIPVGQFVALDAGSEGGVVGMGGFVLKIVFLDEIKNPALVAGTDVSRSIQIEDGSPPRAEHGSLVISRHVTAGPVLGTADGATPGIEHHHEARKVPVHGTEAVIDPRSQAGVPTQDAPGIHLQHGGTMQR